MDRPPTLLAAPDVNENRSMSDGVTAAATDQRRIPCSADGSWPDALRISFATISSSATAAALIWGPEQRFYFNRAFALLSLDIDETLFGVPLSALGNRLPILDPDAVQNVLQEGQSISVRNHQRPVVRTGGWTRNVHFNMEYSPLFDAAGTRLGVQALILSASTQAFSASDAVDGDVVEPSPDLESSSFGLQAFQDFAQRVPNFIWTAKPDGSIEWLNRKIENYFGESESVLRGKGWLLCAHPDDRDATIARWKQSVSTGEGFVCELRLRRHDGVYRWHLVSATAVIEKDGSISRWIGASTDIDDQKSSEVASSRDNERMWMLSQDLLLTCDRTGLILRVNPAATQSLGWHPSDMVGKRFHEFIHPDDPQFGLTPKQCLSADTARFTFEARLRHQDGSFRLLYFSVAIDDDRIHAAARDITDERRFAKDRERIWNLSPVVKIVVDQSAKIQSINPSWTRVLGWTEEETLGQDAMSFLTSEEERADAKRRLAALSAGESQGEQHFYFRTRDGGERCLAINSVPEDGTIYSFGRDVTAERAAAEALAAAEEALRQSQKMEAVGQLTGGIAHDFNNLLQGISGSLEIIERRLRQGRFDVDRFLAGATAAASRAASLTHRLLAFSRRQPLDPRPVAANPLVESMEDLLRRTLGEQIEFHMALADDLWMTLCDPNQLENALLNLVINARDAMPEGGVLTVETSNSQIDASAAVQYRGLKPGDYICIAVSDTGSGMDQETISRAFEPFFTTKPIGQGTGLGLSMIYGFARQSDGYTRIYSEPGIGTSVRLYLPRHDGPARDEAPVAHLSDAHATNAGEVVLVVEDEPVVRSLIVDTLQELGYKTLQATDGADGLNILHSDLRIDLLVTDMGLPGYSGREVAEAARATRPDLKILFITGYAENAARASGFLESGMQMLTKPFTMESFAERIRRMLRG